MMRSRRVALIGVGAVMAAGLIAGCGGSDDDSGELSKDDYIAQADQICADFSAEAEAGNAELTAAIDAGDIEGAADIFDQQLEAMTSAVDEFKALEAPSEDQETIDEFIALSDEQVVAGQDLAAALRSQDQNALEAATAAGDEADTAANEVADAYGFVDCGSAGDAE